MKNKKYLLIAITSLNYLFVTAQSSVTEEPAPDDETIIMSAFEVTDSKDVGYQSSHAAEVARMNIPISDIPMNVTIFNQQFIDDLLAVDSTDVLQYDSSLVQTSENDGFIARGYTQVGSNFLNGFAQTAGFGAQPLANIERIEVIKGPAAVLYGQGGFGATINRITKQPKEKKSTSLRTIFRGNDSVRMDFDFTGPLLTGSKKLLYRLTGAWEDSTTYIGTTRKELAIAPSIAWQIARGTKLTFEYMFNRQERQGTWDMPIFEKNYKGVTTPDGVFHSWGNRDWNFVEDDDFRINDRNVVSLDLKHAFTRNFQFRAQLQYEHRDQKQEETITRSLYPTILYDAVLVPRYYRTVPRETENFRTRNELVWQVRTGPFRHRFLGGVGYIKVDDRNKRYQSKYNESPGILAGITLQDFLNDPVLAGFDPALILPLNLFDRDMEPSVPRPGNMPTLYAYTDSKTVTKNTDFYLNDLVSFARERISISAGVRHSDTRRTRTGYISGSFPNTVPRPTPSVVKDDADATTHSFGLVVHLNSAKTLTVYGNLNNSFEPEFRVNSDGEALKPLEGKQKEVGVKFSMFKGRIQGLAAYYDIELKNVVYANPASPGDYFQVDGQESRGFELGLNTRITDSWLVYGGYSYTDSRVDERDNGSAPKKLARAWWQPYNAFTIFNRFTFNQGLLKGFSINLGALYNDERPIRDTLNRGVDGKWRMPAYLKLDLILGYTFRTESRARYDITLKIRNLTNNTEILYYGQDYAYSVQSGREWEVALRARF